MSPFFSAAPIEVGCTSDQECPDTQACENRLCTNPCYVSNPCSPLATCRARNHRAQCFCPPGMTGDGYRSCTPSRCIPFLKLSGLFIPALFSFQSKRVSVREMQTAVTGKLASSTVALIPAVDLTAHAEKMHCAPQWPIPPSACAQWAGQAMLMSSASNVSEIVWKCFSSQLT